MSKKARRRPSWKKEPRPFYINLINDETDELMNTIKVVKGSHQLRHMIRRYGPVETERRLRQGLLNMLDVLERTKYE